MSKQIFESSGVPEYTVAPIADYRASIEKTEMLDDVAAFDKAEAILAADEDARQCQSLPASSGHSHSIVNKPFLTSTRHRALTTRCMPSRSRR